MVYIFIEMISTVLLLSSSLLLILWKNDFTKKAYDLIRIIGWSIFLIGFYKLFDVIDYFYNIDYISSLTKIPALIGLIFLMFGLFKFLEVKK